MPWLFIAPALILIFVFYIYPIFQTVLISFKDYNILNPNADKFVGISNFKRMLDDSVLAMSVKNTVIYVVVSLILQFVLGFMLALLLWKNFKGRGVYQALVFVPWAVAGFLIGIMFRWMFNAQYGVFSDLLSRLGFMTSGMSVLSNPQTALWGPIIGCVWYGVPYFAIMLLSALQGVSNETIEAAHMDGAGPISRLFKVIIPAIKPTILITLLLRVIWVFNSADIIFVMTNGGPVNASHTVASYLFQLAYTKHDYSLVCAVSLTIMIVLMIYSMIYLKVTKFEEAGEV
ncbi:MAG: sugar ABC transporter permease [Lachnospiraceae bacterium]